MFLERVRHGFLKREALALHQIGGMVNTYFDARVLSYSATTRETEVSLSTTSTSSWDKAILFLRSLRYIKVTKHSVVIANSLLRDSHMWKVTRVVCNLSKINNFRGINNLLRNAKKNNREISIRKYVGKILHYFHRYSEYFIRFPTPPRYLRRGLWGVLREMA